MGIHCFTVRFDHDGLAEEVFCSHRFFLRGYFADSRPWAGPQDPRLSQAVIFQQISLAWDHISRVIGGLNEAVFMDGVVH
jgi:hypothetical protein